MLTKRQKQPFNTEGKTETKLDSQERLTKYTAMSGVQYTLTYTGDSRDPATITSDGVRTTYTYDAAGNVDTTTVQPTNGGMYLWSKNYYDETKNFCVMSTGVDGATSERSYDVSTGLLTTSKTPRGQTTAYNYDTNNGRILSTDFCQRNNGFLFYQYANNGQLLQLNRKSFYCGSATRQAYHFTYDAWGNTTKIEVGKAAGDEDNSLSSATQLAQYSYDTAGKMIEMRYPSGQFVTYGYDVLDRLVSEKYYKNVSTLEVEYQYIYNANGQLAKQQAVRNGVVTESYSFAYDSLGRLIRSREEGGSGIVQRTEHLYDTANRLTKQSWMLGTKSFSESYSYRKNDGALDHIDTATGDTVSYGYDALKRVNSVTTKNSAGQTLLTQSNTFQSLDSTRTSSRLSTYTVKGANQQTIVGNRYSYDPNGNITKIEEANGSGYRVIAEYVYDWMDQLCKETRYTYSDGSSNPASTTVVEYASDTAGNLRSVRVNGTETLSYTYGDSAWADKLTMITVNGKNKTIQYADALNPGNWYNGTDYTNLTWTQGRRLSSITKGSSTYSYEYDMSGVRSVKIVDGWKHEYVTQNGKVIRDKVTDASTGAFQYVLEFGYDESGRPLTLRWYYNEAETWYNAYYYICNAQGDVVKLVSDSGATIAAYSYDAWGTLLSIQGESNGDAFIAYANPLRYRGYYYDTETGFYYLQSRYYDPIVKRFLNADSYASTGQGFLGFNMFAYCGNNPVKNTDPTGETILPDSRATIEEQNLLVAAIDYLMTSNTGAALINALNASNQDIYISFNYVNNDAFTTVINPTGVAYIINWDPTSGLILADGISTQSAALGLLHELGHAAQHLDGSYNKIRSKAFRGEIFGDDDELHVIWKYEIPAALELKEPIRLTYNLVESRGLSRMSSVTEKVGGSSYSNPFFLRIMDCARSYILQALE